VYINKYATDQEENPTGGEAGVQRTTDNHQQISNLLPAIGFPGKKQQYKGQYGPYDH
jgi:hypothetical protein